MAEMIKITDFNAPELDVYARMNEIQLLNRHEPEKGMFIAESPKVIARALDGGYTPVSFLVDSGHMEPDGWKVIERCPQIPVYDADAAVLRQLTGFPMTRGILCAMRRRPLPDPESFLASFHRIAVLEHVVNPTNVGAIFRSAAALNMDAVLLCENCSNPLYRRAARVSMGTVFQVPWTILDESYGWPGEGLSLLKRMGYKTVSMALREDSVSIADPRLKEEERLAVILGTEGDGLASETIEGCDYTVRIPMSHGVDSLNVAAASAVAFWELGQRK